MSPAIRHSDSRRLGVSVARTARISNRHSCRLELTANPCAPSTSLFLIVTKSPLFWDRSSRTRPSQNSIAQVDDAVGKRFGREQRELDVAMARGDERDAFADENRDHVDAELVDLAFVEERGDELAAAHHHDFLVRLRAQALCEGLDGF